jgi:superfamily II DNA or RNA helicase
MADNDGKMMLGLRWEMRAQMNEQDQVVFSFGEAASAVPDHPLRPILQALVDDGAIAAVDLSAGEVALTDVGLVHLLYELAKLGLDEAVFHTEAGQQLQLALDAFALAQTLVWQQDVIAAAFVSSFSPFECLRVLRETAAATDDIMPSWGSGNGTFVGVWVPAWSTARLRSQRMGLFGKVRRFVTACLGKADVDEYFDSMDWLLLLCVDVLVRKTIVGVNDATATNGGSYRVMYRGEADVISAWQEALRGAKRTFTADGWLVAKTMRQALQKSGWMPELIDDQSGESFYELSLCLMPPTGDGASADWQLYYQVRHRYTNTAGWLDDWWRQVERVWPLGDDMLLAPDTWILPALKSAGAVCPQIRQSLMLPAPNGCIISADDVYGFLTESVPQLRALGVVVEAPNVLRSDGSRVRVRVRVKRAKAEKKRQSGASMQGFDANRLVDFDWSVVIDDEEVSSQTFAQLVAAQTPFIQVNGSWRLVPVDEILRQINELGGLHTDATRLMDLSRVLLMPSDEEDIPVEVDFQEEAQPLEQVLHMLSQAADPPLVAQPSSFLGELRHYQQIGYSWLLHLRSIGCGACLADDMGLGKTVQVLAYLLHLQTANAASGVHLLVCPTSLLPNWKAELKRFAPSLRMYVHHGQQRDLTGHVGPNADVDLVLTTYATLVRDLDGLTMHDFDTIIVDEAQNIKNADTKQAQAIRTVVGVHRIALTGTPMENRLEELWALMDFLNPGYLGTVTWFRKMFVEAIQRNPNGETATKLQVLLRPVLLRRRKSDPDIQTELPEKWEVNEHALLTSEQAAVYQALVNQLFTDIQPLQGGGMSRRGQILATLVRLKQVCDHPCLISGGNATVRRSGKLRQLVELLSTVVAEGECALVFTQFRDMGEIICDALADALAVRPKFLHGGLNAAARGEMVEAFQKGTDPSPVLVLSLRAGGVGLNLTRANHVFHFDRWWNPAVEDQATDRAYRIGQTKDVQVHKMVCAGTLEERIDKLITMKRELSQAIVGGSSEWVTELDDDALRALFALDKQSVWEEDEA